MHLYNQCNVQMSIDLYQKIIYIRFTTILLQIRPQVSKIGAKQQEVNVPKNFCKHPIQIPKTLREGVTHQTCWKVMRANSHPQKRAIIRPHSMVIVLQQRFLPQLKHAQLHCHTQSTLWAPSGSPKTSSKDTFENKRRKISRCEL